MGRDSINIVTSSMEIDTMSTYTENGKGLLMNFKPIIITAVMRARLVLNEGKGVIVITALLLLGILTLLGVTAVMLTLTELKISDKGKQGTQAFYLAEAGIEEARARIKGSNSDAGFTGDPDVDPDQNWSAYILTSTNWQTSSDPQYNSLYHNYIPTDSSHTNSAIVANSLQTDHGYWVKIQHNREYDAELAGHTTTSPHYFDGDGNISTHSTSNPGNIIYYGFGNPANPTIPTAFTASSATQFYPIELITSYAHKGVTKQVVKMEVARNPGLPASAAIYGRQDITINGASGYISGEDNCGKVGDKPPLYTLSPATTTGHPTFAGTPSEPVSGSISIDVANYADSLKGGATVVTSDLNGTNFGSSSNFLTVFSDTSNPPNVGGLKIQYVTGYGILIVDGDLTLGGGFSWYGLIIVTGTLTMNGGGSGINIKGAIMANDLVDINGGLDIRYDSCQIDQSLQSKPMVMLKWRQIY